MKKRTDQFEQDLFQMAEQEQMIPPKTLYQKAEDTFRHLPKQKHIFQMTWKKSLVLAAALIAMCSVTVMAAVGALQQRMEAMNGQEIEDYFVQIYASRLGADHYSRPVTDTEQTRMEELTVSYEQDGVFPEKVLTMIRTSEEYKGTGIAFSKDTSTFFLPDTAMSDEELLQIIDFRHRRDYSLQTMNEKISAGETGFPEEQIRQERESQDIVSAAQDNRIDHDPEQELTIPYTGDLEIQKIEAGQDCIFLMGKNAIHRMAVGDSDSELFFDDFDTDTLISALYEDKPGNIYLALNEQTEDTDDQTSGATFAGKRYRPSLWILQADGTVTRKVDLASLPLGEDDHISIVRKMVVDEQGYIYLRAAGVPDALLIVLDSQGNYVKKITSDLYTTHDMSGLGIGRDGKVYTQIQTRDQMGIASINLQNGSLDEVYMDIVPVDTVMLDLIAPGSSTDLVFWGYDGIFTYNFGEVKADCILPAYEAPCGWENALYCALPDGRIVIGECAEYQTEGEEVFRIPESVCFHYISSTKFKPS